MKKVTEQTVNNFKNGISKKISNSETFKNDNVTFYYLYDNCIATLENDILYLSNCGYKTNTTKERLNGILNVFNLPFKIYQKNYIWYIGDKEFYNCTIDLKTKKIKMLNK